MRLLSVTLRNYRMHRELTVSFDGSLTVIGGPNEAGKSTVIEAVHRALFLRSRASGEVLESMRSNVHAGHPAVELTFACGGSTYTVTKQFTGAATAPTMLTVSGGAVLRNEEAEKKLRHLVAAEQIQGRNVEDRLRMQWAHLWVWQGTAGDSPLATGLEEPLGRLRERLGNLEEAAVMESRVDAGVGQAVAEVQAQRTKVDGTPKADSPLGRADAAVEEAGRRVAAARATIATLEAAVATIARADGTVAESDKSLAARRREQEETERSIREAQALEVLRAGQQAAATAAAERLETLTEGDRQICACDDRISAIEARRRPAAEEERAAVTALVAAEDRLAAARDAARDGRQKHAELSELAELYRQAEHLEQRRAERNGLAGRCGRIAAMRTEADDLERRCVALPAVTAEHLTELGGLERQRDAAQAKLDAIATRVELISGSRTARLGDLDLSAGDPQTITSAAELRIEDAVLRITPGGGTSLAEAMRLRDAAAAALDMRLREIAITDVDEARRVQPLRQTLESALMAKRTAITDLGGDQADRELAALDREITALEAEAAGPERSGFTRPAGVDAATVALKAVADRLREVGQAMGVAAAAEQAAEQLLAEARVRRDAAAQVNREIDLALRDVKVRRDVLVEEHGEDRAQAIAAATQHRAAVDAELAATEAAIQRLQPELLRQTAERLTRAIDKLATARQTALADRAIAIERLRSEGTLDPRDDLAQALAAEQVARAAQRQAAREARAYALLARLFAEKRAEIESRFVAPLASRVAEYLTCVFGPATTVSVGYSSSAAGGKAFTGFALSRPEYGGVPVPFDRLSGGAREQTAAAFRLAMAEILAAEHGGCLPVVFDDAFVNSDQSRIAAVQAMLDLAASRGLQVIVLSCNHRDYDGLGAEVVELSREMGSRLAPGARGGDAGADVREQAEGSSAGTRE
jgi:chromosome segregation ATPase